MISRTEEKEVKEKYVCHTKDYTCPSRKLLKEWNTKLLEIK